MRNSRIFALLVTAAVVLFIAVTTTLPAGRPNIPEDVELPPGTAELPAGAPDAGRASGSVERLAGDHLPLMIRWSNWRPEFGPAIVYAREQDLEGMLRLEGPLQKMLMVTSYGEAQRLMRRAGELKEGGVTTVGLNTENGLTPGNEMRTLDNPDPEVNVVARVAELARQSGFNVVWGPVRRMADAVSDEALRTMIGAGVQGLAIQEQKFIEVQPANIRLRAVNQTRERYLRLAASEGVNAFVFHVQIMHERCPDLENCITFVQMLEDIPVASIAIWSNGPIPPAFVEAIRSR